MLASTVAIVALMSVPYENDATTSDSELIELELM